VFVHPTVKGLPAQTEIAGRTGDDPVVPDKRFLQLPSIDRIGGCWCTRGRPTRLELLETE
jgi:hypothetical protein